MTMNLTLALFVVVVVVILACIEPVHGMAELTEEMMKARNIKELLNADHEYRAGKTANRSLRHRMLQERKLQDSMHILADQFAGVPGFYHGVASGDPLADAVIVWTRYTPINADDSVKLEFRIAKVDSNLAVDDHLNPDANPSLHRAKVTVTSDSDFVAKIDVTGLVSGSSYVFGFSDGTTSSMIGQTKTAPGPNDTVESMTYAVFSCSHFANGYFHAYDVASTIKDLDFWIHLGDYVYEYGLYSSYATDAPERKEQILPLWEQISLQDYRNRMATYHTDEGLQNLRARAPLIACWDDHETTNNPWGDGSVEGTGAENHQEVCPVGPNATDAEKDQAQCDRDEGSVDVRFNDAAQSYFEWMPIRHQVGEMGVIKVGDIVQKISWGDMATIVTFDTRISHRSKDPTLNSNNWGAFFPFATVNTDVSQYTNASSPIMAEMMTIAEKVHAVLESDNFTMIGEDISVLTSAFQESKDAGQPWQIWATGTALGRAVKGNYYAMSELVEDANVAALVKQAAGTIYGAEASTFFRALSALALTSVPWNRDDYSGFAAEQRKILAAFKEVSVNPVVLAGDLHDGYAWQLYEDGAVDGTPTAVNLVCPGVTSPGWGPFLFPAFSSLSDVLGSSDDVYNLMEASDEAANPGLKYYNMQYKGFFAVKVTKEEHIAEYFVFDPETILTDYDAARQNSGSIVADFRCDAQLTTMAGLPGSLDRSDACSAVEFDTERSPVLAIPFPNPSTDGLAMSLSSCGYDGCEFAVKPAVEKCPVKRVSA